AFSAVIGFSYGAGGGRSGCCWAAIDDDSRASAPTAHTRPGSSRVGIAGIVVRAGRDTVTVLPGAQAASPAGPARDAGAIAEIESALRSRCARSARDVIA